MRWFASWIVTVVLVSLVALALWLRVHPPFGIRAASDGLGWLIPAPVATLMRVFQVPLMFGTLVIVRLVLHRVLAYTASATDASPRARPGKRATLGSTVLLLFHNPTGGWLASFATLLGLWVAVTGVFVFMFHRTSTATFVWGLMALYTTTLVAAAITPDGPQPLRAAGDEPVDPILRVPGVQVEPAGP